MHYNVPEGYVLVTEKTRELVKKFNLDENKEKLLYRSLLEEAKLGGRKYNDNPNSRIWLLSENIDEKSILKKIDPHFGDTTLFDIFPESLEKTKEEDNNIKTISLIRDIIDSDIESNKCLDVIRALLKI